MTSMGEKLTTSDFDVLVTSLDDGDGTMDYSEFVKVVMEVQK